MKIKLKIARHYSVEPEVIIQAPALTPEVEEMLAACQKTLQRKPLVGERAGAYYPVVWEEVCRLVVEERKLQLKLQDGQSLTLNCPLYEALSLAPPAFIQINKSEGINVHQLSSLELLANGLIALSLKNGDVTYCSRHFVPAIKERVGL